MWIFITADSGLTSSSTALNVCGLDATSASVNISQDLDDIHVINSAVSSDEVVNPYPITGRRRQLADFSTGFRHSHYYQSSQWVIFCDP